MFLYILAVVVVLWSGIILYLLFRDSPAETYSTLSVDVAFAKPLPLKSPIESHYQGVHMTDGRLVLLTSQENPQENGVYRVQQLYLYPVSLMPLSLVQTTVGDHVFLLRKTVEGHIQVQELSYVLLQPPAHKDAVLTSQNGRFQWSEEGTKEPTFDVIRTYEMKGLNDDTPIQVPQGIVTKPLSLMKSQGESWQVPRTGYYLICTSHGTQVQLFHAEEVVETSETTQYFQLTWG